MKSSVALLLVLMAGCMTSPARQVTSIKVDETWMKNPSLSLAVLDIYANDNSVDPAFFQLNLGQALRELGYEKARSQAFQRIGHPWKPKEAAGFARRNGHDAVLVCTVQNEAGLLTASIRVIDAKQNIRYEVRVELPAEGASEEDLISGLLAPLERIL